MNFRIVDDNKYIILWKSNYYLVNAFTKDLLLYVEEKCEWHELRKKLGLSRKNTKELFRYLSEQLEEAEYGDNINLSFPLKIQWRITERCNLKCLHCYLGDLSNNIDLEEEKIEMIAKKLASSQITEITITGGEALLVKLLPQIVEIFIKNKIKVNIYTNGILLNSFIDNIIQRKVNPRDISFFISLDGLKETHEKIRGIGTFDKVINNILYAKKYNCFVTTNTVINKLNYKDIPILYLTLFKLGVDQIQISNVFEIGNAKNLSLDKESSTWFLNAISEVIKYSGNRLLYAKIPDEEQKNSQIYSIEKDKTVLLGEEKWKCAAGIGKATVTANGDVLCCPFLKESILGNILTEDLREIWNKKERQLFLKKLAMNNNNSRLCLAMKGVKRNEL